ncbi:MAG: hypothetical protein HYT82_00250 [Candidatus Harrisonbacteria bacterium]|nr:hypothetical protein [Candidatus Harrisonbacteria bacterium]
MKNSERPESERPELKRPETVSGVKKTEGEKIVEKSASPEKMRKYLYSFAYTTPGRAKSSEQEERREVFIIADSSEKALEWGKHLSDAYVSSIRQETEDFRINKGAEWVESEEELRAHGPLEDYSEAPLLRYGEEANLRAFFKE